jgi:glycosyltransferase involved in cell wall biosynthesis
VRTLYICYFGVREPLVQTQVIPYLRELTSIAEVSLLTFEPEKPAGNDEISAIKEKLAADGIEWYSLPYHKQPSVPATAYDVTNGARFIRSLIKTRNLDVLHARSHVPMLMARLARKWSRIKPKIVFDIRGFFPEEYTDAGLWPEGGWLYRAAKRVERTLLNEADGFVVLTEKARQILFSASSAIVEVIPCCVDMKRFASANTKSRKAVRSELGIGDRKVLVYVGAFGGWYLTDEMVDLFAAFKEREPDAFAMILTQSKPDEVRQKLQAAGYGEKDLFIQRIASSEIPRYLSAADISVSFIKNCYSKQASSPTKNAEYLACGLPIIANTGIGDTDEQITANQVGTLVTDFRRKSFMNAFEEIERLGEVGDRCRETAERLFDLEAVGGVRYRRLYERLLGSTE